MMIGSFLGESVRFEKLQNSHFKTNQINPKLSEPLLKTKLSTLSQDKVSFRGSNFAVKKHGNVLHVISFTGTPELPSYGVKVKIRGVMRFQKNCQKVLDGNWKDGDALVLLRKNTGKGEQLQVVHPQYGMVGRIPEEIAAKIMPLMDKGHRFNLELSDVVGGTVGASTIGLRANLIFALSGNDKINNMGVYNTWKYKEATEKLFASGKVGEQLTIKPEGRELAIYHKEFGKIGEVFGKDAGMIREAVRNNTYKATVSAVNKGSKKYPDTIFVKFNFENTAPKPLKDVPAEISEVMKDITTDNETKNLAFPYQPIETPEKILEHIMPKQVVDNIQREINNAKSILLVGHKSPDGDTLGSVLGLNGALKAIGKQVDCCVDDDITGMFRHKLPSLDENIKRARDLTPNKKYDLVILMDTPTPARVGGNAAFIKTAKKVVFIDHHPMRKDEWDKSGIDSGVDFKKIEKDGLLWVQDDMPAAAEMVAGLVMKIIPKNILDKLTPKQKTEIAVPLVTGMLTDTGNFSRGADKKVESFAKYLMNWADFGKKWIRDNISYNIPGPAREKMVQYSKEGITKEEDIQYGSMQIPYDKFMDVFNTAKSIDKDVVKQDIINEFKYSEVFSSLRSDPKTFDDDKIAVSMIQKSSKDVEGEDVITMSFRSGNGSNFAQKLAENFGGGGHGAASGASAIGHSMDDKVYTDASGDKNSLTLERKIAELARDLREKATNNVVSFTGWINKLRMAS